MSVIQVCPGMGRNETRRRLDRYIALGAAGVSVGLLPCGASASVIQSDPSWSASVTSTGLGNGAGVWAITTFGLGGSLLSGSFSFRIFQTATFFGLASYSYRNARFDGRARLVGGNIRLGSNVNIAPGTPAYWIPGSLGGTSQGYTSGPGDWGMTGTGPTQVRGYLGFRAQFGTADFYYGWFDVEYSRNGVQQGSTATLTIHGWAYNSTPNAAITTPQAVPGHAGLAAVALGAAGVRGRRRGRK